MNHIRTFESFRDKNKENKINEEFIGGLFKNLKNKLSIGFSNMFGTGNKVDKLMEEYKNEVVSLSTQKREALKAFGEYMKQVKQGGELDQTKLQELKKNLTSAEKNYDEQLKLAKEKFDIKFREVVKEEKNEKIKNYITLKKIEMQQALLAEENSALLANGTLKAEDIDDPIFKGIIEEINKKMENSQKMAEEQKKQLELKSEKVIGFDVKKAKEMSASGNTYLWEESPFKDFDFPDGDKIVFFSSTNKEETNATVTGKSETEGKIKAKTERGTDVEINKMTIISSEAYDKKKSDESEAKDKSENPEAQSQKV